LTRILAFGGAFNPPSAAHIACADAARIATGAEAVMFIPSKMTYIRNVQKKDYAFSDEQRLSMLRKIAEKRPWMMVTDYELTRTDQPRTYETLCMLWQGGYTPSLLIGSDKLSELQTGWRYVEEIAHQFGIVVMSRSHDDCHAMIHNDAYLSTLTDYITIVQTPDIYQDASSSAIRAVLQEIRYAKEKLSTMVPEELEGLKDYI
jgi:nicotinate (nicotinamide) nucleotide adenylyltransferase